MRIMLLADKENMRFYNQARNMLDGHQVSSPKVHYDTIRLYLRTCKKNAIHTIVLSNCALLVKIVKECTGKDIPLYRNKKKLVPSMNWAGAAFEIEGIKIIISRPFRQLVSTGYGKFLLSWYVNKHTNPRFPRSPEMVWERCTQHNIKDYYKLFKDALYIGVDIETTKQEICPKRLEQFGSDADGLWALMKKTATSKKLVPCIPLIDMIGYCGLFKKEDGTYHSISIVLDINSMEDIYWMRKFNNLSAPKITQNGGYEASYLIRYNAPLWNWLGDTFHFMHSWYSELPRTLDFISSLFIADYQYWKDEIESNRGEYNAKDTHNTLWSWVFMVNLSPQWAKDNYLIEFRKCFPAITSGLEGFLVDLEERERLDVEYSHRLSVAQERLNTILYTGFNASSPVQVKELMNSMSLAPYKATDDKALRKFSESGALEALLVELILEVRRCQKKLSTYIRATLFDNRLLYEINHGGTDTGRAASKSSNFWTGTQIQNQDNALRTMYVADTKASGANEDWLIANCDGSQAESRCTGYISEDAQLIDSVENAPDFHTRNASLFFGIPEDEIVRPVYESVVVDGVEIQQPVRDADGKIVKDKSIRTLSKRVNHGSNYNMGASVLLETMGTRNVLKAKDLLELPARWGFIKTCNHLLGTFDKTYPDIKGKYYPEVCEEIRLTGRLTVATGWTRYCFELPRIGGNKPVLNKYVAHKPQCLSVMLVDEAEFDFWYKYQIKENMIRLKTQVHDEIVYMVRNNGDYEITKAALSELMARPCMVRGREMIIPNDGGGVGYRWGDIKD